MCCSGAALPRPAAHAMQQLSAAHHGGPPSSKGGSSVPPSLVQLLALPALALHLLLLPALLLLQPSPPLPHTLQCWSVLRPRSHPLPAHALPHSTPRTHAAIATPPPLSPLSPSCCLSNRARMLPCRHEYAFREPARRGRKQSAPGCQPSRATRPGAKWQQRRRQLSPGRGAAACGAGPAAWHC